MLTREAAQPLFDWANERHAVYMRKAWLTSHIGDRMSSKMTAAWGQREHGPWSLDFLSDDPVFQQFKFCNVYRELDRVTVWIRENIREPFADHPHLWYMLAAARYINWPPVLKLLIEGDTQGEGWVTSWPSWERFKPAYMTWVMERARALGQQVETGAYMIRAESDRKAEWYSWSKQRYVSEVVLGKLWDMRNQWSTWAAGPTLESVWNKFQDKHFTGWGPFMAYQVVVDLRWTRYLIGAPDIQTWAAVGPGSRRGLNRLHGRDVAFPLKQDQALDEMIELRELSQQPGVLAPWMSPIDLSDIQNCLCETDKWLRVKANEGRPRSQYRPFKGWN